MKRIFFYNSFSNIMLELVVWMIYLTEQGWSLAEVAMLEGIFTISQVILMQLQLFQLRLAISLAVGLHKFLGIYYLF